MDHASSNPSDRLPEHLASECLVKLRDPASYPRAEISRLAQLATSPEIDTAKQATTAIFTSLVEPLADSFAPSSVAAYNRVFSQLIQHCRSSDEGREFDRQLRALNLLTEDDLFRRAERLRQRSRFTGPGPGHQMKCVILLSRVTLGADVAITSIISERMKRRFPDAEIVLLGGRKAAELFGGESRISFREVAYQRTGRLTLRLSAWVDVLEAVRSLTAGLSGDEYLIVDPDSRLTQLGLLPLSRLSSEKTDDASESESDYLFFPSREYGSSTSQSLAELTSAWMNLVFGGDEVILPRVALSRTDLQMGAAVAGSLRAEGRPVASINFGVGENPAKGLGEEFETGLVSRLLDDGAAVILDRGAGEDEASRAAAVIREIRAGKRRVVEIEEGSLRRALTEDSPVADLLVWNGRIGLLAAMIGESDLYIGYDSAGQHIAAALGVPCIDVMAGFSSPRMIDRWRPTGPAETRVIVDRGSALEETIRQSRKMLECIRDRI